MKATKGSDWLAILQVRDCPDDLYADLADSARRENRSISQHTLYILKKELGSADLKKKRRCRALGRVLQMQFAAPPGCPAPEEWIREDRDR